jgi:hypothetical protein
MDSWYKFGGIEALEKVKRDATGKFATPGLTVCELEIWDSL